MGEKVAEWGQECMGDSYSYIGAVAVSYTHLFLPLAVRLGYTKERLIAILVMLGSATTVSCFVMAKNMGHEGVLTSSTVMLTTFFSAFTLTGWLFLLKTLGLV